MKPKVFVTTAMFGLQTRLQFKCSEPIDNDGVIELVTEVDDAGEFIDNGCLVTADMNRQRAGISYGPWAIALDIIATKKVRGNYHFKCATDLCRVDLFICEQKIWKEKGEAIFY